MPLPKELRKSIPPPARDAEPVSANTGKCRFAVHRIGKQTAETVRVAGAHQKSHLEIRLGQEQDKSLEERSRRRRRIDPVFRLIRPKIVSPKSPISSLAWARMGLLILRVASSGPFPRRKKTSTSKTLSHEDLLTGSMIGRIRRIGPISDT